MLLSTTSWWPINLHYKILFRKFQGSQKYRTFPLRKHYWRETLKTLYFFIKLEPRISRVCYPLESDKKYVVCISKYCQFSKLEKIITLNKSKFVKVLLTQRMTRLLTLYFSASRLNCAISKFSRVLSRDNYEC